MFNQSGLQIMPGTSSHTKICLNGKGLKRVNSHGQGNHYIDLKIIIPKTLSQEQKALLQVNFVFVLFRTPIFPLSRFFNIVSQAYAELETNTPGQIMGITNKTDGKSTDGNMSDKFTQRSKDRDSYSEHDPTDTVEFQKEQLGGSRFYFFTGIVIVVMGIYYLMQSRPHMDLDYEREVVYQRLAEREEERRVEEEERKSRLKPFREA